jgi:hypothetical protein
VQANALMGPDEISFGNLIRSLTINLWRVFIGSISIKLIRRVFDCPFPLSRRGKNRLPKNKNSLLISNYYHEIMVSPDSIPRM